MALEVTPTGRKGEFRIHGTADNINAAQDAETASVRIDLSRHPSLLYHRYLRVHVVQRTGDATAIEETVLANATNFGGDDPVVGIKVQARLTPVEGQATVVNEQLGGSAGQCADSGALWLFPGPNTGTNNSYDVEIHLLAGWG